MAFTKLSAVLLALAAASGVNATCSYVSFDRYKWNFRVFTGTQCTGKSYEYYGTTPVIGCNCYNIASPLNDNVNSFSFSSNAIIRMYPNAGCGGNYVGESAGKWNLGTTSANGRSMSSFEVCNAIN